MSRYGNYTAEEILKGAMREYGMDLLKIKKSSIESAKRDQLYGTTGNEFQGMMLVQNTNREDGESA